MDGFEQHILTLGYGRREEALVRRAADVPTDHPFAPEIRRMFAPRPGEAGASAVFMHGGAPLACLVDAADLPVHDGDRREALRRFCRRLWNQNLASLVLVLGADSIEAHSVLDPSATPQAVPAANAANDGPWSQADLSSGRAWERHSRWFDPKLRVDNSLLENIVALLKVLCGPTALTEDEARHALAKAIFVSFLEQRGIVGDDYRAQHQVAPLEALVSGADRNGLERLFTQLRNDFNGDFLNPATDTDAEFWDLPGAALQALAEFLKRTDLQTGQRSFWGYDFSEIPIELISGIYQTFLATKGLIAPQPSGGGDGARRLPGQRELGAYYTPRHLAVYVVEQAFAGVADPLAQTIFDGACGSGILLTTAFRHLLRVAEQRDERPLTFEERRDLLRSSIFGSDIDLDACRLTAFSLYLALLSELQPSDLVEIQRRGGTLPNLIGTNLRAGPTDGDIFAANSVAATRGRFSLVISNPPWREPSAGETTTYEPWMASLADPPSLSYRQIAIAYTFRALECLKPGGRIALVLPVRLIVGERANDFRCDLTEWMRVEQVVNFADMRRLIFPGAKHPFAVITGVARDPAQRAAIAAGELTPGHGEVIEYLAPKADVALAFGRLAIHSDDRMTLPAATFYSEERLFGLLYWGTEHDVALYRKCQRLGRIEDLIGRGSARQSAWLCNSGWVAPYKDYPGTDAGDLREMKYLDARAIPVSSVILDEQRALQPFPGDADARIAFFGERALYRGPRVIWPDGVNPESGVKAFYSEAPFTFRHSLKAIGGVEADRSLLQFLAAYLRSPLAHYLMILRSHTVAGERPKLHKSELLAMPFVRPERHPVPDIAYAVLDEVSRIFETLSATEEGFRDNAYSLQKGRLDALVLDYFQLSDDDRVLVKEMVERVAPSIQPSSTDPSDLLTPLLRRPSHDDLEAYARVLQTSLEAWRDGLGGGSAIDVSVAFDQRQLLAAATISLGEQQSAARTEGRVREAETDELVRTIEDSLAARAADAESMSMMALPHITVASGRTVRLIKPFRARFWLQRAALADADRLVQQIRAAARAPEAA
ncbi:MAG: N-6 DNA methylase [Phenylobacterium sp.]|uniref:N-6 DNA methylase n=1 Tax=Phenylobacterium sp. TaxID=1871053 RepID=UPI002736845D|nr:N-6 DNA methylase [Phenylobacterium sp.]MDP3746349.1 N-6 DNA methylase [Phenylobacterium sp.]